MLTGTVIRRRNRLVPMRPRRGQRIGTIAVVLDTGFNGELAMPASVIPQLDLVPMNNRYTYLAVGGEVWLSAWRGTILQFLLQAETPFAANAPP